MANADCFENSDACNQSGTFIFQLCGSSFIISNSQGHPGIDIKLTGRGQDA